MFLLWAQPHRTKLNQKMIVYLHDPNQAKKNISQRFIEGTRFHSQT